MSMKKTLLAVLAALILWAACPPALAEARYPERRGAVTDDTNVLSREVLADIASFQTLATSRAGVTVYVALVHFLDGLDAQTYANTLFTRWGLGDNDFLLLGAVGEDSFASASGKEVRAKVNDQNAQGLLFTSGFGELFRAQRYDAAFSGYFVAFADMLGKQYGTDIPLGKLFAGAQADAKPARTPAADETEWATHVSDMWDGLLERVGASVHISEERFARKERESRGTGSAGWIVLLVLAILIFGRKGSRHPLKKWRKGAHRSGCGCGCSPLVWVFTLMGLGLLFGDR